MNKNQFDEMQTQKRNHIGNQSFSLLVMLLMLDALLYSLGIRWIEYPMNVFLIVIVCCGVFVIRSALNDSLVAPKQKARNSIMILLITLFVCIVATFFLEKFIRPSSLINQGSNYFSILLNVISWGIIITSAAIHLVKKYREKNGDK